MKQRNVFPALFSFLMLLFVLFLVWYIPSVTGRTFALHDVMKSLETSQGRERKQQYEYDKVIAEIPELQEELDLILPQAEAAEKEVSELKAERKKLREEKKELEKQLNEIPAQGGTDDEK